MVKSKVTTHFLGAFIREGAETLNLRAHEEGVLRIFIDTTKVRSKRWRPPPVEEDWHAVCQAIFQGVEGPEWEAMNDQYKDVHQAVKSKKSGETKKAKVLWVLFDLLAPEKRRQLHRVYVGVSCCAVLRVHAACEHNT